MTTFLIIYYIFSVLFMLGYTDVSTAKWWEVILLWLLILLTSPVMFPINLGYCIYRNTK